jgi:hypothetical protein
MLNVQRHPHAETGKVRGQVKDVALDAAKPVQRKDHTGQHCDAQSLIVGLFSM